MPITRTARSVVLAISTVGLAAAGVGVAFVAPAAADTQSFSASAPFTVPAHVCAINVDAVGGAGGGNGETDMPEAGGSGGEVQATLIVTPGETLQVSVGQAGTQGNTGTGAGGPGFNNGGDSGAGDAGPGGGGGGSSAVSQGGTALVIGGGGGGAAGGVPGGNGAGGGGTPVVDTATGGSSGFDGQPTSTATFQQGQGGGGGNATGAGGTAGGAVTPNTSGIAGGASNSGGAGGTGGTSNGAQGSGGGGGGFSGGGGGGGGNGGGSLPGSGSGGGGASFANPNPALVVASSVVFPNPSTPNAGNGHVVLTWTADPAGCPPPAPAVVVAPRFTG